MNTHLTEATTDQLLQAMSLIKEELLRRGWLVRVFYRLR